MSVFQSEPSDQSSGLINCADSVAYTNHDANDANCAASSSAAVTVASRALAPRLFAPGLRLGARRGQALVEYVLIFLLVVIVVVVLLTLLAPFINSAFHNVAPAL
jgi:Flp pilus assembly pilin Flp